MGNHTKELTIQQGRPCIRHIDLLHWPIPVLCILRQTVCIPSKHSWMRTKDKPKPCIYQKTNFFFLPHDAKSVQNLSFLTQRSHLDNQSTAFDYNQSLIMHLNTFLRLETGSLLIKQKTPG